MTQMNQLGILRSKILKQSSDTNTAIHINMLEANVFKYGHTLNIDGIIINKFTKIDNTVPTLSGPAGCYFFDMLDDFKLKNYNNKVVPDGYYRLKSNISYYSVGITGWRNDDYYLYNIVNGIPINFATSGYYIDLDHSILTFINNNGISNNAPDGLYFYNKPYCIIKSTNNITSSVEDGIYLLKYQNENIDFSNFIYEINAGNTNIFNEYFINIDDDNYYYKQIHHGTCSSGTLIITEHKILIKTMNTWKFINLSSL